MQTPRLYVGSFQKLALRGLIQRTIGSHQSAQRYSDGRKGRADIVRDCTEHGVLNFIRLLEESETARLLFQKTSLDRECGLVNESSEKLALDIGHPSSRHVFDAKHPNDFSPRLQRKVLSLRVGQNFC
jgi:hypothetical protein